MPIQPDATPGDMRQGLLRAKLGGLLNWRIPEIARTVGPYDLSVFEAYDSSRLGVIQKCERRLQEYSDLDIGLIAQGKNAATQEIFNSWRHFLTTDISRLREHPPPWYAAGFGHPDHQADFDYWCKMPKFSIAEGLALSLGVEPDSLGKPFLTRLARNPPSNQCPPLDFLMRRYQLLRRQFDPQNSDWSVRPDDFLDWVRRVQFEVHPEFLRLLNVFHPSEGNNPVKAKSARNPDRREIDKIAQLFTAMAIEHLRYQRGSNRSPIPKEIVELAATMGLKVSEDTVRKYLRLGESFIPGDWGPS